MLKFLDKYSLMLVIAFFIMAVLYILICHGNLKKVITYVICSMLVLVSLTILYDLIVTGNITHVVDNIVGVIKDTSGPSKGKSEPGLTNGTAKAFNKLAELMK